MQFLRLLKQIPVLKHSFLVKTFISCNNVSSPTVPQNRFAHNIRNPKLPELLYFPHVFRWLKAKYQLKYLQKVWDPEFSEGGFIYGSTHAICRVTEAISANKPQEFKDLVSQDVAKKLTNDMKRVLTENQRKAIKLTPDDIKLLVPMRVHFDNDMYKKMCRILLKTLAMKWVDVGSSLKLALVVIEAEFLRDYSFGTNSEWCINTFNILQCSILNNRSLT